MGSFVNALVWRLHEQSKRPKQSDKQPQSKPDTLSILHGRSMCPHCRHNLAAKDLIPVLSWLSLGGKCRYCRKPISWQYPLVELATAALFVLSYAWWPDPFNTAQTAVFVLWLLLLTGLMALLVYDLRWYLLPNKLIYPLSAIAGLQAVIIAVNSHNPLLVLAKVIAAVAVGGGIFYLLFQISEGKWIGGGDVKLGWLLGLIAATPARSVLFIFIAAMLGTLISLPLLASKRLKRTSVIPFGPFLIAALVIVQFYGAQILTWYQRAFLGL